MYRYYTTTAALAALIMLVFLGAQAWAADDSNASYETAREHFLRGEYKSATKILDGLLEEDSRSHEYLTLRSIAQNNMGDHAGSLAGFYELHSDSPKNPVYLAWLGIGLANLGEYEEARRYFDSALLYDPENMVIQNYADIIDGVLAKYPYTPTEKPQNLAPRISGVPEWFRHAAGWWHDGSTSDDEFLDSLDYMISGNVISVERIWLVRDSAEVFPAWTREAAGEWAAGASLDDGFDEALLHIIRHGSINTGSDTVQEMNSNAAAFSSYISRIERNIEKEKRYIEYPNPSGDVIKKFLRDYEVWNFDGRIDQRQSFPDPEYGEAEGKILVSYRVFVNEQPTGLPLDHVGTLKDAFGFWEDAEIQIGGRDAMIEFHETDGKGDANVWVTWVVRDLGEGVLGHAHLGKGIVEVALGDYACDGRFQLYDVDTVRNIMIHELGHSIGLPHSPDEQSIMYPSLPVRYAYCLLG